MMKIVCKVFGLTWMGKDTDWMDVEGATAEETEANIKKQRDEAARWMANKSIEDNAAARWY